MASVRTEPGWVTRDVIWVSHNSPPFWKLCKVWGKVYRRTGHHDIVSMSLPEGLHSRHKNGGLVHLFLWGTSSSPHRPLKTHYTGRVLFPVMLEEQTTGAKLFCMYQLGIFHPLRQNFHTIKWNGPLDKPRYFKGWIASIQWFNSYSVDNCFIKCIALFTG